MNAATPFPWSNPPVDSGPETSFLSIFEQSPVAAARCDRQGKVVERNSAFEQFLDQSQLSERSLSLCDLVPVQERAATQDLLRDLLAEARDSIRVEGIRIPGSHGFCWTVWRQPRTRDGSAYVLLIGEPRQERYVSEESLLQMQRWEAVGRLVGGVVHDFNNLLTGVMLYCDLLLSNLDPIDRRRRYATEIRSAILHANGLVRQLLGFAKPQTHQVRSLSLNQIIAGMQDLLTRLIGANIALDFRLDPDLGLLRIDPAQAQQIILNLVLNARDAIPNGGCIVVQTSNCKFESVAGAIPGKHGATFFPCVLLEVGDNGEGMDAKTRQRLFEPFFTTKVSSRGTGLGLSTVRSIVTTNGGLIHVESEPGRGSRVLILLPRASQSTEAVFLDTANSPSYSTTSLREAEVKDKEETRP